MIRTLLLAALLIPACARPAPPDLPQDGGGKKEEKGKQEPAPLTEQERMDWRKHSRGWGKPTLTVAALRRDEWGTFHLTSMGPEWRRHAAGRVYFDLDEDGFRDRSKKRSTEDAAREAARPGTTAAVIVDLASDPIAPVLWFVDKGDGPKESKEAPSQELADSLAAYLLETQRKAPLAR